MKKALLIPAMILFSAFCLRAQTPETVASTDPDPSEERMDKLKKFVSKLPSFSGFVDLRYQYNGQTDINSFDVRRARLDIKGGIGTKVGYRLQVEFANTPRVLDAYVQWQICDWVGLRGGQFKIPFSLETRYSPTTLETMNSSLVIKYLMNYEDPGNMSVSAVNLGNLSSSGRDIGLRFNGDLLKRKDFSMINWAVGVFNGAGINRADDNKQKDFSGMLTVNPIKDLSLAIYHYNGWGYQSDPDGNGGWNFRRIRSGGGAKYDDGRWLARGEFIWGKSGSLHSQGAYAVLGYMIIGKVQPVLKYDYFQSDLTNGDTRWNYYTAGVSYEPIKYCRLQVNYSFRTSPGAANYHYVGAQVFGIF